MTVRKMELTDVVAILAAGTAPDEKILLDDGEYFIQHNVNYAIDRGNGFLMKRVPVSHSAPGGEIVIGEYDCKLDGKWLVDVRAPWDEIAETDCRVLGNFADRLDAIATLWLARHEAYAHIP